MSGETESYEKMKLCPFTGKKAHTVCYSVGSSILDEVWFVNYEENNFYSFGPFATEEQAIKAWNTRKGEK